MKQIAIYLSHYAPFKWMYVTSGERVANGTLIGTLTPFLWVQTIIIIVGFFTLLLHVLNEEIRKRDKIKTMLISFPIIPLECFLSYFLINDITIITLNVVAALLFFIISFEGIFAWDHGGGWIYSSLISYYKQVKSAKEKIKKYQQNYNQLVNFKF